MNILLMSVLCVGAWLIGVHILSELLVSIYYVLGIFICLTKPEHTKDALVITLTFIIISGIASLLYGDFNVEWVDINYLFTKGE